MNELGEAISTVRRACGLTQEQLAARAGITQGALSRYEKSFRTPDDEVLERIAAELGVTPRFLTRAGIERGAMGIDAHMRRRATAKASDWRFLEARLNKIREHSRQLFEEVSLRSKSYVPSFDPLETPPEEAARMVRMQWKMPSGPVRSLLTWMESAGTVVVVEGFTTKRVDGLSQWIGDHPVVLLNRHSPVDRMRLTTAHELGHLCLHSETIGEDVEREANLFAAEFLMPASVIKSQLRNLSVGALIDLKRQWGVSMQALIERAASLKTISSQQRTNLYKYLSARGMRIREPGSDEIAPEQARLVREIVDSFKRRGFSEKEVANIAGFSGVDTNDLFIGSDARSLRVVSG